MTELLRVYLFRSLACIWKQYKRNNQKWNGYDATTSRGMCLIAHQQRQRVAALAHPAQSRSEITYSTDRTGHGTSFKYLPIHLEEKKIKKERNEKHTWGQRASISHVETRKNVMISLLFECVKWKVMEEKAQKYSKREYFMVFFFSSSSISQLRWL